MLIASLLLSLSPLQSPAPTPNARPKVVFVTGDEEYRSEESMPMLAAILERDHGIDATVLFATNDDGEIAPNHLTHIGGLEALADADLLVMFTRFRALPDDELQAILDYAQSGRPMVGFRTATHAFLYKDGPNAAWNDEFSVRYFGQKWITHHGHESTTSVTRVTGCDSPILRGVEDFEAPSWLYHVEGGGDALPADHESLMRGTSQHSSHQDHDRFPLEQTVAWTRKRALENGQTQRVFFTTLGHPYDFAQPNMRRLALQGILWALGRETTIPEQGVNTDTVLAYHPTQALYGGAIPGRRPASRSGPSFIESPPSMWPPRDGLHITLVGGGFAERMAMDGQLEAELHRRFPDRHLIVRSLAWPGDTPGFQPRPLDYGSMESHLTSLQTDVVVAVFGYNESFPHTDGIRDGQQLHNPDRPAGAAGVEAFRSELTEWLRRIRGLQCSQGAAPKVVLLAAPAPFALLPPEHPYVIERAAAVERMNQVLRDAAELWATGILDLSQVPLAAPLVAGFELDSEGYRQLLANAPFDVLATLLGAPQVERRLPSAMPLALPAQPDRLLGEVRAKQIEWYHRYRAVNGFYIYGGRKDPFGVISFPGEMQRLDAIVEQFDRRIWELAQGAPVSDSFDMESLPALPQIETNFTKPIAIRTPAEQMSSFTLAPGYAIELVASEIEFPELQNPVSMTFDTRGRLWVSVMPSYPQVIPGTVPNDKLLIFEDDNGDGHADRCKVFADGLYLPAGFELGHGGAYVAQMPNLAFLPDGNGDDRADDLITVLHGFGTEDSHHALSAFVWDPAGGLHFQEGTFHHSQIETAWGPVRVHDGAVFRFDPANGRASIHIPYGFYNPWGHVFDRYGREYVGDASDGGNYLAAPMATQTSYERYRRGLASFTKNQVRPTGGAEIISGSMFPAEVQGDYLISNTIGFQGIRAHRLRPDGSGVYADESWDVVSSSDPNFRPIDLQFGPDGALYFVDWFNPLIGHMQHSLRDPKRDHDHGRIWRVVYRGEGASAPKAPSDLSQLDADALLALLTTDDGRLAYRVRRAWTEPSRYAGEGNDKAQALAGAARRWLASTKSDRLGLDYFWLAQRTRAVIQPEANVAGLWFEVLGRLLRSKDARVRAAAIRALPQEWPDWNLAQTMPTPEGYNRLPEPEALLEALWEDPDPNVRLEAVTTATRIGGLAMVEGILRVQALETDPWLEYAIDEGLRYFQPLWVEALRGEWAFADSHPDALEGMLARLEPGALLQLKRRPAVCKRLLLSPGIPTEVRRDALAQLGGTQGRIASEEWLVAMQQADTRENDEAAGLVDLALGFEPDDLRPHQEALADLAHEARHASIRLGAMLAWLQAAGCEAPYRSAVEEGPLLELFLDASALWLAQYGTPATAKDLLEHLDQLGADPTAWPGYPGDAAQVPAARFVRIDLPGIAPLTLAEVEVWSAGQNIALEGTARQSSTEWGGLASHAIDGDTNPSYASGSQSHTAETEENSWWELDLGSERSIEHVTVWSRTEGFQQRLAGFGLSLLDADRRVVWSSRNNPAPERSVDFAVQTDWRARIRRAALHALAQADWNAQRTAAALPALMAPIAPTERGAPWYQDGLLVLAHAGREDLVRALQVALLDVVFQADGSGLATPRYEVPAQTPIELRIDNQSPRQANLVVLAPGITVPPDLPPNPEGQRLFAMYCSACHKPDGGGLVGPNMTDDAYIHIRKLADFEPLVRKGIPEKAMTPFESVLNDEQIDLVIRHMSGLRGQMPTGGLAPQGELVAPWRSPLLGLESTVAASEVLDPGKKATLRFNAPNTPGTYTLQCTLPNRKAWRAELVVKERLPE